MRIEALERVNKLAAQRNTLNAALNQLKGKDDVVVTLTFHKSNTAAGSQTTLPVTSFYEGLLEKLLLAELTDVEGELIGNGVEL